MKTRIITLLTIFLTTIFSQMALSATDVSCWDQSCLTKGWTSRDLQTGQEIETGCYRDGCKVSGWIIGTNPKSYTQCKSKGCFKEGWYQLHSETQTLQKQVVCRSRSDQPQGPTDCLKYGWVTYSSSGQESTVTCFENNCAQKGWLSQTLNLRTKHAYCKNGGCFVSGWSETDY